MLRSAWLIVASTIVLCAGSANADALPRRLHLEYARGAGTESCPEEQMLSDAIRSNMRFNPFREPTTGRVIVTLTRGPRKGFAHLHAEIRDETGVVRWNHDFPSSVDCETSILAIAIMIGSELDPPGTDLRPEEPIPPETPSLPQTPTVAVPLAPMRQPAPISLSKHLIRKKETGRSDASFQVGFGLGGALALYAAPPFATGSIISGEVTANVALRWRYFSVGVEGQWQPPAGKDLGDGRRIEVTRYSGGLLPCGHWRFLYGCIPLRIGGVVGMTHIGGNAINRTAFYLAAGGRAGVELSPIDPIKVRLYAELLGQQRYINQFEDAASPTAPLVSAAFGAQVLAFF